VTPRLAAKVEVSALIRRVEGLGGSAAVLARGDATAGTILLYIADRGAFFRLLERRLDETGAYRWSATGPQDVEGKQEVDTYIERRRRVDGDLWVVELDVAGAERFVAEMIAVG
jgi:hypothetical protein